MVLCAAAARRPLLLNHRVELSLHVKREGGSRGSVTRGGGRGGVDGVGAGGMIVGASQMVFSGGASPSSSSGCAW